MYAIKPFKVKPAGPIKKATRRLIRRPYNCGSNGLVLKRDQINRSCRSIDCTLCNSTDQGYKTNRFTGDPHRDSHDPGCQASIHKQQQHQADEKLYVLHTFLSSPIILLHALPD